MGNMNAATDLAASLTGTQDESFAFVQTLANELSAGKVELIGFPEIVARIQQVLSDDEVTSERVAKVLSSEPTLAAEVLHITNSAAFNPSGKPVTELRTAIARLGLNVVRTMTIAFAVRQLRRARDLKPIEQALRELWERNVSTASLCYVLAKRFLRASADTALLTGLLQGIGRLYIMTRAVKYPGLFTNQASYQSIERDWHTTIAAALLENWQIASEIVEAVRDSEDLALEGRGAITLTDIVICANLIANHQNDATLLTVRLQNVKAATRLQLDLPLCESLLVESAQEITILKDALG
jgi:HD-like signal output (HDOD) protein